MELEIKIKSAAIFRLYKLKRLWSLVFLKKGWKGQQPQGQEGVGQ
jgi:hypothetical protein